MVGPAPGFMLIGGIVIMMRYVGERPGMNDAEDRHRKLASKCFKYILLQIMISKRIGDVRNRRHYWIGRSRGPSS